MSKNIKKQKSTTTVKKRSNRSRKNRVIKRNITKKVLARNFLVALFLIVVLLSFSYFLLENSLNKQSLSPSLEDYKTSINKDYSNEEIMDEVLEKEGIKEEVLLIEKSKEKIEEQQRKEIKKYLEEPEKKDEIIESKSTKKIDDKKIITKKDKFIPNNRDKAKIVIIIDDVVSQSQVDKILKIGYPVNISFLPPTKDHKNSAKIAQNLNFSMIHFPLQASKSFKNFEDNTLNVGDSYEKIEARVKQLRNWYPKTKYTNNHTGSIFTEDYESMNKLFKALKKYGFIFVDSKTSPNSVVKELSAKYKTPYIVRDTFLDNEREYKAIEKQLKEAIKIAKTQGYAVAIGHPYDITFKVLKESKHLLEDLEPIFLNKLPYL